MNRSIPATAPPRPHGHAHCRACAATLASVIAIGYVLPVSSALAEGPQAAGAAIGAAGELGAGGEVAVNGELGGQAELSVLDRGGRAVEPLQGLTLPQLASLLKTTPAELTAQIEALGGNQALSALLRELLAKPTTTLEDLIGEIASHGAGPAPLVALVKTLSGSLSETSTQLKGALETALGDLALNGALPAVAEHLQVAKSTLEAPGLLPTSPEELATTLKTTAQPLAARLAGAGAMTEPLTATTPLITAPVDSALRTGTTELVGTPGGESGMSLITLNSTPGPAGPAGPAGATASTIATSPSSAFTIVWITVTKSGAIVERVTLPGPGRLAARAIIQTAAKAARGHGKTIKRTATIASMAANVSGGTHTLTLHPRGLAGFAKRTRVTLLTTYTPTGGYPNSRQNFLILKRPARVTHKQGR